ncbi:ATP-binding SpoIIE family protein phosphatase [Streptomyces sp. NPDC004031]
MAGDPAAGGSASCTVDARGRITAWGGDAQELLGFGPAEAVGRPVQELLGVRPDLLPWGADTGWTTFAPVRDRTGERIDALWCAEPLVTAPDGEGDGDGSGAAACEPGGDLAGARCWAVRVLPQGTAVRLSDADAVPPEQEHGSRRRLAMVYEASLRIGNTLDVFHTADELALMSTEEFADYVTVDLLEQLLSGDEDVLDPAPEGGVVLRRTAQRSVLDGCPEAVVALGDKHVYPAGSPAGRTLATGHGFLQQVSESTLDWWSASPERQASIREYGIHSALVVPLRARGVTLGLAMFCRHRTKAPYEADDLGVAEELARRAAVCVDNARRYTRERATAVMLQRSLLPGTLATPTAVEAAARYRPAGSRSGAGGDWYDVIPLSGARVALVVGDVVGHGLRAAAAMGRLRAAVRTLADIDLPPDEVLTRLDDVITRLVREAAVSDSADAEQQGLGEMSATCLYAVYDPVSRNCWMASAGHPPPAVVSPDGEAVFADLPVGPPLGIGGLPFEAAELRLAEGSLLAFYTDGLVKAPGADVDSAMETMRALLTTSGRPLEETCDLLLRTLLPSPPADDVALLLVRTRALSADRVASWDVSDDPAEVARVRKIAVEQLDAWGLDEAVFTMELVISELVTNAIRHGRPPVRLRLIRDDASLFCEVSDGSSAAPHLRRARVWDEGGRGLLLVAQLTDRWGTRHTATGKIIWTEQDITAPER